MRDGTPKILFVNTAIAALAAVFAATATCSFDRLEQQVIALRKTIEQTGMGGGGGTGAGAGAAVPSEGPTPPATERVPGEASPVEAVGWGGRRSRVTYVEGAVPNAPLRPQDKPRPQGDWYVQHWTSVAKTMNYYTTNEGDCSQVVRYTLWPMLRADPDAPSSRVLPELATRWDVSEDKLTYTFHLRKGVQFADGRPFTSADVKFSFDCVRDPEVGAAHMITSFEDVVSLEPDGPHKVVVKMKRPYWRALYTVGFDLWVLNKGWYEEVIPKYAKQHGVERFATEPGKPGFGEVFRKIRIPCPGAGPYYMRSEDDYTQERCILVQNPFWFGQQVRPEHWNFVQIWRRYIKDPAATDEAFLKQEFDVMSVPHDRYEDQLKDDAKINSIARYLKYDHTGIDTSFISWNCRKPPFDDARVRTAMTHLVDRKWILERLYRGNGQIATCRTKPSYPEYSHDLVPHPFDPDRARALLAEAGWSDTDGDGVLDKEVGGRRVRFEFKLKSSQGGGPSTEQIAGQLKSACAKVGIRMTYVASEWSSFIGEYEKRDFEAALLNRSWQGPWIDNFDSYHSSADIPDGGNACGWRDPRVDQLLEAMRVEFDPETRKAMFHEFNRLFHEAQPETLFAHPLVGVLVHKRLRDATVRPSGLQPFPMWVPPEEILHK